MHEWACLRSELVWIYDAPLPASSDRIQENNRKQGSYAWLLRKGHVRLCTAIEQLELTPGNWCFLPDGRCRQECSDDTHLVSVHFLHQWPSGQNFIAGDKFVSFPAAQHPELERNAVRLDRLVRRHFAHAAESGGLPYHRLQSKQLTDARVFLRLQTLFLTWLHSWLEIHIRAGSGWTRLRAGDDRPLRAARLLNEAPLSSPYPRAQLHAATELSEVHLTRLFIQEFGLSPRRYWDKRRLQHARQCLETSVMPVKEIAYRLGFLSDSHFATWFRRQTKKRPGDLRLGQNHSS